MHSPYGQADISRCNTTTLIRAQPRVCVVATGSLLHIVCGYIAYRNIYIPDD